jgi:amino acid permease
VAIAFPSAMKKDKIFSNATASKLSIISLLITLAGALIIICAVMLAAIGDKLLFFPLLIIASIALLIAFMLSILSNYVKRAALLKDEVDSTL